MRSRTMTKGSRPVAGFRRCVATAATLALVVLAWALPAGGTGDRSRALRVLI